MTSDNLGFVVSQKTAHRRKETYDFFQNVDFVEEHSLLFLVHVALSEHLDGTLGLGLSVDAHADLAERT